MAQYNRVSEENPTSMGLVGERGTLVEQLNNDLAGEFQSIVMYIQYSSLVRGLHRTELRNLFQTALPDEQRHARMLADKIAVLGGIPTTTLRPVPRAISDYQMLRNIHAAETRAIADYMQRIAEAGQQGEIGLKVELEFVIADETRHKEAVQQILAGWNQPGVEPRT